MQVGISVKQMGSSVKQTALVLNRSVVLMRRVFELGRLRVPGGRQGCIAACVTGGEDREVSDRRKRLERESVTLASYSRLATTRGEGERRWTVQGF